MTANTPSTAKISITTIPMIMPTGNPLGDECIFPPEANIFYKILI